MLIGLLRVYAKPASKDMLCAMLAKEYGCEVVYFTPDQIDFENRSIHGLTLREGQWVSVTTPFPDVAHNDISKKGQEDIFVRFEEAGVPLTTHRFGKNKLQLNRAMGKDPFLKRFMIESIPFTTKEVFLHALDTYGSIFLKPNRGHKGAGIAVFEKNPQGEGFFVQKFQNHRVQMNREEIAQWLDEIENPQYYHIQPKIKSNTIGDDPFVIRSYVCRNGRGKWIYVFSYAAIGLHKNSIVNVSVGSGMSYIEEFLQFNYGEKDKEILAELKSISVKIADSAQKYIQPQIDAVGIDLGITREGNIYMFEINAYPGTRPFDILAIRQGIAYAIYLGKQKKA